MKKRTSRVIASVVTLSLLLVGCGLKEGETEVKVEKVEPVAPVAKTPSNTPNEKKVEFLYENEAFRVTHVAIPDDGETATIKGYARVYEGTVSYAAEDGHAILTQGFTTASVAAPEWGEFEFSVNVEKENKHHVKNYVIVLFEESVKDGTPQHELPIPISIEP